MEFLPLIVCGLLGLMTTWLLIPVIRRRAAVSAPANQARTFHHTHTAPVPRLGGIALAVAFALVAAVALAWFPPDVAQMRTQLVVIFSSLAMFLLGLWDDFRPLGARKKLLGQILISIGVCCFGVHIENFQNPLTNELYALGAWGWVVTVFWLVALTNMINLIDGIDGLAGGIALMMMGLLVYVGFQDEPTLPILCAAGMFGALLGFLRYNFPPAKIYMGDSGAYFLGFLIAILTLVHSQKGTIVAALIAPLFALALPILDVSLAIVRRGLKGLPIFRPDRRHIHHRLLEFGFSRTRTVLILYGISSVFLLMAFGVFWSQGRLVPIFFGFACLALLLSARTFNFSRDWFAVGRVLENSLELRKETHYALALGRWLEMEGERARSVESLWADFGFVAGKLGFTRARLELEDGKREWESSMDVMSRDVHHAVHELGSAHRMALHLEADSGAMSLALFDHLSELAAEAWLKATARWQEMNGQPIRFDSRISNQGGVRHSEVADGTTKEIGKAARPA